MLENREQLISFRKKEAEAYNSQVEKIIICAGTGCVAGGSLDVYEKLKKLMSEEGINVEVELKAEPHERSVGLKKRACRSMWA